jgi:hypothetical protein
MIDSWQNVQNDCMLCEMEKRTDWYIETRDFVVAEKLGGGPFVVVKEHKKQLDEWEWLEMERTVGMVFKEFNVRVMMNIVEDHWHGHLITDESVDLSDE